MALTVDELRVILSAENAKLVQGVQESERRIASLGQTAAAAGDRSSAGFERAAVTADRMGSMVNRAMGVMTRLDLTQITLEQTGQRVREAQEAYNQALAESGPHSQAAAEAQRELEAAQAVNEKATLRARASYLLTGVELVSMGAHAVRAATRLGILEGAFGGVSGAARGARLAIAATGIGALVVGVGFLIEKLNQADDTTNRAAVSGEQLAQSNERVQRAIESGSGAIEEQIATLEAQNAAMTAMIPQAEAWIQKQVEAAQAAHMLGRGDEWAHYTAKADRGRERLAAMVNQIRVNTDELRSLNKELDPQRFRELTSALNAAGVSLDDLTQAQLETIFAADGLSDVEENYLRLAQAEEEARRAAIDLEPALVDQMNVSRRKGETLEELAERLGLTAEQEARLREQGQLTTDGLITQEEATRRAEQAARDHERAMEEERREAERLAEEEERAAEAARELEERRLEEHFQLVQSALSGAGLSLDDFTLGMQRAILAAGGLDAVEAALLDVKAAEAGILREALDLNPALLDQITVSRKKGETNEELADRLGLTTEQEQRLLETGRLVNEGIISQEEATRRLLDAQSASALPAWTGGQTGFVNPIPSSIAFVRGEGGAVSVVIQRIEVPVTVAGDTFDPATVGAEIATQLQRSIQEALD